MTSLPSPPESLCSMSSAFVHLNNEGLALLQQGQHMSALSQFRRALDILRQGIDEVEDVEIVDSSPPASLLMSVPIASANDDLAVSPHNIFCFYSRAFYINAAAAAHALFYSPRSQIDLTLVLLFNMGVTCHQHGLITGNKSSYFLQKALGLYKMIVSLFEEQEPEEQKVDCNQEHETSPTANKTLLLALWSNMGHLYSHFFMNKEAKQCRQELQKLLAFFRQNQDRESLDEFRKSLSEDEYIIFVLNAILMANITTVNCSPAA